MNFQQFHHASSLFSGDIVQTVLACLFLSAAWSDIISSTSGSSLCCNKGLLLFAGKERGAVLLQSRPSEAKAASAREVNPQYLVQDCLHKFVTLQIGNKPSLISPISGCSALLHCLEMMKRSVQSHLSLRSKPFFSPILFFFSSSASSTPSPSSVGTARTRKMNLTREELTKINLLIPRLCESNHLPEAIRLVAAALLLSTPPLESLSLSLLIDRLASQPDMAQPMSLLNRLKHTPSPYPSLQPIAHMLLSSYLMKRRLKEAIKVLNWMSRPDSPSPPDNALYALVIGGLCTNHMGLEALKVLQAMLVAGLVPGNELRMRLYGVLLAEAMIGEARELNEALKSAASDGDSVGKVLALLDHLILNWID